MDILKSIEFTDLKKKDRIEFEKKKLHEMTLPEIAHTLNELQTHIENNPELSEEEEEILNEINLSAEAKVMAWGYVIKNIQESQEINKATIKHHEDKIKELKQRNSVLENRIQSRLWRVRELMTALNKRKLEGPNYKVAFRKMPEKVIINEDASHTKYYHLLKMIPTSFNWDKSKIKKWLKNNESDDFKLIREPDKIEIK